MLARRKKSARGNVNPIFFLAEYVQQADSPFSLVPQQCTHISIVLATTTTFSCNILFTEWCTYSRSLPPLLLSHPLLWVNCRTAKRLKNYTLCIKIPSLSPHFFQLHIFTQTPCSSSWFPDSHHLIRKFHDAFSQTHDAKPSGTATTRSSYRTWRTGITPYGVE